MYYIYLVKDKSIAYVNISGIFILFADWGDCVDRNDKVFTLLFNIIYTLYQLLFHFGPPLPGILTRPHVMLRPFVMSNDTERGRG